MIYEPPRIGAAEHAAIGRIEELRRQLRYHVSEPRRWYGPVRRVLAARAIQGSNSIEGYNVSVEDAVAAIEGDDPMEARTEDWHAVVGYRRAMTYVLQLSQDPHFEYTAALIRSLHFMMTDYSLDAGPGLWRPGATWIRNDASGDVVYEGPDAADVPELVEELVQQLVVDEKVPSLVRAAMAHLNLVMIHPFRDGNGRMARCLQTLVLSRDGILAAEFSSIEEYLGANTAAYYDALADVGKGRWNPHHDARPWVRFCLEAHYIQATSVLRRVREAEQIWSELEAIVNQLRVPQRSIAALFDATLGLRIRNSGYRAAVKSGDGDAISPEVATTDLRALVNAGLLELRGRKRGAYYVATGPLLVVGARWRHGRQPIDTSRLFDPDSADPPQLPPD